MSWSANIMLSRDDVGVFHLEAKIDGSSREDALSGAEAIKGLTDGKTRYMRCQPEADSYQDFDTKETTHRGYVRYSFRDEAGDTIEPEARKFVSLSELSSQ